MNAAAAAAADDDDDDDDDYDDYNVNDNDAVQYGDRDIED